VLRCLAMNPAERPATMMEVAAAFQWVEAALETETEAGPGQDAKDLLEEPVESALDDLPELAVAQEVVELEPAPAPEVELELLEMQPSAAHAEPAAPSIFTIVNRSLPAATASFPLPEMLMPQAPSDAAAAQSLAPWLSQTQPAGPETSVPLVLSTASLATAPRRSGFKWVAVAAVLAMAGALWFAQQEWDSGQKLVLDRLELTKALEEARQETAAALRKMETLEADQAARRLVALARSRDESAQLVAALLATRPSEATLATPEKPASPVERQELALAAWKPALATVAERMEAALKAADAEPSLMSGSMEPRWQLAQLYTTLDRHEDALPLLEHLSRDLDTEAAKGKPLEGDRQLLAARTAARRGAILWEARKAIEAAPLLSAASAGYDTWIMAHPDQHEVAREYAENSLLEGRALAARQQLSAARPAFVRIAGLLGQPGEPGFEPLDHLTLSDSLFELATMESTGEGKLDLAIEQHMQAIRLLVNYDQANRQSIPCRRRLADGYFGLGTLLMKNGTPRDASVAFSEAVKLLTELSKEAPAEPAYRVQLALTYNEVAQLIRTSRPNPAGAKEALDYQNGSVTILRNLNDTNTLDSLFRQHLSSALVLNGELLEIAGDSKTGQTRHTEALALLEGLLAESTLSDVDRRECRRLSARAWTALGGIQEKAGKKDDAIASLSKALEAWTSFAGNDPAADQIVASTRERLRKLKPES
jgi:Tetratricopeptide repeat